MICNTILDAVGNTPIIKLNRITDADSADILVKFEALCAESAAVQMWLRH